MDQQKIKVLVVDDSALMRNLISRMVEESPELGVVGKAMNGYFALNKIPNLDPDVIVLDLEMPEMNGIQFLEERAKRNWKIPVVILSSLAAKGAKITMQALDLGASDFVQKPSGSISEDIHRVKENLNKMLVAYGQQYQQDHPTRPYKEERSKVSFTPKPTPPPRPVVEPKVAPSKSHRKKEVLAIGISTGGPNALRGLLKKLPADFPWPILIVQHMPAGFTSEFAQSLNRVCSLEVKEAQDGDLIRKGRVLVAPGDRQLSVERKSLAAVARVTNDPPMNGHRPSAGFLFHSVAEAYGEKAIGLIMTGMGRDGSAEIGEIYRKGGLTIAQDAQSSVVYGMPKVAAELGNIEQIVSLEKMADFLGEKTKELA